MYSKFKEKTKQVTQNKYKEPEEQNEAENVTVNFQMKETIQSCSCSLLSPAYQEKQIICITALQFLNNSQSPPLVVLQLQNAALTISNSIGKPRNLKSIVISKQT